jgi:hypothetical protein
MDYYKDHDFSNPKYKGTMRSKCIGFEQCQYKPYLHLIKITHKSNHAPCRSCDALVPGHIPQGQVGRYLERIFRKGEII